MPKKSRRRHVQGLGDVTLDDYANSPAPNNRLTKPSCSVRVVLKKEVEKHVVLTEEVEKSWDEKDEEEFDGEFVPQENDDGTVSYVIQKVKPRTPRNSLSLGDEDKLKEQEDVKDYPIDIWYLLSEYIRPEDVGTFAAICKTSFEVVSSARFWFVLYRRYYKNVPKLPEFLQPESLIRKYGLRKNVICALYRMYQPFIERLKLVSKFEYHPESLENFECSLFWYRKLYVRKCYIYFFKMKKNSLKSLPHSRSNSGTPDLLKTLDDVSANPDENCGLLRVLCSHFYHIQHILGQALKSVSLTRSETENQRFKLQLIFGPPFTSTINLRGGADNNVVILDPVVHLTILDWWHPEYPLTHSSMKELFHGED